MDLHGWPNLDFRPSHGLLHSVELAPCFFIHVGPTRRDWVFVGVSGWYGCSEVMTGAIYPRNYHQYAATLWETFTIMETSTMFTGKTHEISMAMFNVF